MSATVFDKGNACASSCHQTLNSSLDPIQYTRYGRCLDKLNMHIMHIYIYHIHMMIVWYCRKFATYCNRKILLRYQFIYQGLFQILNFFWLSEKNQTTFPLLRLFPPPFSHRFEPLKTSFPPFCIRTNATEVPRIVYTGTSRLGSAARLLWELGGLGVNSSLLFFRTKSWEKTQILKESDG